MHKKCFNWLSNFFQVQILFVRLSARPYVSPCLCCCRYLALTFCDYSLFQKMSFQHFPLGQVYDHPLYQTRRLYCHATADKYTRKERTMYGRVQTNRLQTFFSTLTQRECGDKTQGLFDPTINPLLYFRAFLEYNCELRSTKVLLLTLSLQGLLVHETCR